MERCTTCDTLRPKPGYETALEEWYLLKALIDGQRASIAVYNHHLALFNSVLEYWNACGVPQSEKQLQQSVVQFVELIQEQLKQPVLPERINVKEFLDTNPAFSQEFYRAVETDLFAYEIPLFGTSLFERLAEELLRGGSSRLRRCLDHIFRDHAIHSSSTMEHGIQVTGRSAFAIISPGK